MKRIHRGAAVEINNFSAGIQIYHVGYFFHKFVLETYIIIYHTSSPAYFTNEFRYDYSDHNDFFFSA